MKFYCAFEALGILHQCNVILYYKSINVGNQAVLCVMDVVYPSIYPI